MLCRVYTEENSVVIQFPGGKLKGPHYIEPALRFITNSELFTVKSVADNITDKGKIVLIRSLVKQGLLIIV